jgi:gliding motility-associated-like protein
VLFPNVFTPLKGGANNTLSRTKGSENCYFAPKTSGVEQYSLQIFNKSGLKVFESNNLSQVWDGYFRNTLLPQDAYVWKVKGVYNNGQVFEKSGSVLLMNSDF